MSSHYKKEYRGVGAHLHSLNLAVDGGEWLTLRGELFHFHDKSCTENIFNMLFIILPHGKLKLKNTNVDNCITENIHIVCSAVPYNEHPDDD